MASTLSDSFSDIPSRVTKIINYTKGANISNDDAKKQILASINKQKGNNYKNVETNDIEWPTTLSNSGTLVVVFTETGNTGNKTCLVVTTDTWSPGCSAQFSSFSDSTLSEYTDTTSIKFTGIKDSEIDNEQHINANYKQKTNQDGDYYIAKWDPNTKHGTLVANLTTKTCVGTFVRNPVVSFYSNRAQISWTITTSTTYPKPPGTDTATATDAYTNAVKLLSENIEPDKQIRDLYTWTYIGGTTNDVFFIRTIFATGKNTAYPLVKKDAGALPWKYNVCNNEDYKKCELDIRKTLFYIKEGGKYIDIELKTSDTPKLWSLVDGILSTKQGTATKYLVYTTTFDFKTTSILADSVEVFYDDDYILKTIKNNGTVSTVTRPTTTQTANADLKLELVKDGVTLEEYENHILDSAFSFNIVIPAIGPTPEMYLAMTDKTTAKFTIGPLGAQHKWYYEDEKVFYLDFSDPNFPSGIKIYIEKTKTVIDGVGYSLITNDVDSAKIKLNTDVTGVTYIDVEFLSQGNYSDFLNVKILKDGRNFNPKQYKEIKISDISVAKKASDSTLSCLVPCNENDKLSWTTSYTKKYEDASGSDLKTITGIHKTAAINLKYVTLIDIGTLSNVAETSPAKRALYNWSTVNDVNTYLLCKTLKDTKINDDINKAWVMRYVDDGTNTNTNLPNPDTTTGFATIKKEIYNIGSILKNEFTKSEIYTAVLAYLQTNTDIKIDIINTNNTTSTFNAKIDTLSIEYPKYSDTDWNNNMVIEASALIPDYAATVEIPTTSTDTCYIAPAGR